MRSLAHEFATQRNATPPPHESRDAPVARVTPAALAEPGAAGPTRRAVLRRALRMGLLRPASRLRDVRDPSRGG